MKKDIVDDICSTLDKDLKLSEIEKLIKGSEVACNIEKDSFYEINIRKKYREIRSDLLRLRMNEEIEMKEREIMRFKKELR